MAKYNNVFLKGRMNKDLDDRVIQKGEYRDALNIEVSTSEDSDVGTVQNIKGNYLVSHRPNNLSESYDFNLANALQITTSYPNVLEVYNPQVLAASDTSFDYTFNSIPYGYDIDEYGEVVGGYTEPGPGVLSASGPYVRLKLSQFQIEAGRQYQISFDVSDVYGLTYDPANGALQLNSFGVEPTFLGIPNSLAEEPVFYANAGFSDTTSEATGQVLFEGSSSKTFSFNYTAPNHVIAGIPPDVVYQNFISFVISTTIYKLTISNLRIVETNIFGESAISSASPLHVINRDNALTVGSYVDNINDRIFNFVHKANDFVETSIETSFGTVKQSLGVRSDAILEYVPDRDASSGTTSPIFNDIYKVRLSPRSSVGNPQISPTTITNIPTGSTVILNESIAGGDIKYMPLGVRKGMRVKFMKRLISGSVKNQWASYNVVVTDVIPSDIPNAAVIKITGLNEDIAPFTADTFFSSIGADNGDYLEFTSERILKFSGGTKETEENTTNKVISNTPNKNIITAISYEAGFIYFTDGKNEPKKINVQRFRLGTRDLLTHTKSYKPNTSIDALVGNYGSYSSVSSTNQSFINNLLSSYFAGEGIVYDVKERHITVIKQNPHLPPTVSTTRGEDFIEVRGKGNYTSETFRRFDGIHSADSDNLSAWGIPLNVAEPIYTYENTSTSVIGTASMGADWYNHTPAPLIFNNSLDEPLEAGDTIYIKCFTDRVNFRFGDVLRFTGQSDSAVVLATIHDSVTPIGFPGASETAYQAPYFNTFGVTIIENSSTTSSSSAQLWQAEVVSDSDFYSEKFVSFAYRYKYMDDEVSCLSPYSAPVFTPGIHNYSSKSGYSEGMINNLDVIKISDFVTRRIPEDVKQIEFFLKDHSFGNVFSFKTISTNDVAFNTINSSGKKGFISLNSETSGTTLPGLQLDRVFDAVPVSAKAQDVTASRLMYGNYCEGYEMIDSNLQDVKLNLNLSYNSTSPSNNYSGAGSNILYASSSWAGNGDSVKSLERTGNGVELTTGYYGKLQGGGFSETSTMLIPKAISRAKFWETDIANNVNYGYAIPGYSETTANKIHSAIPLRIRPSDSDSTASGDQLPGLIDPSQTGADATASGNYRPFSNAANLFIEGSSSNDFHNYRHKLSSMESSLDTWQTNVSGSNYEYDDESSGNLETPYSYKAPIAGEYTMTIKCSYRAYEQYRSRYNDAAWTQNIGANVDIIHKDVGGTDGSVSGYVSSVGLNIGGKIAGYRALKAKIALFKVNSDGEIIDSTPLAIGGLGTIAKSQGTSTAISASSLYNGIASFAVEDPIHMEQCMPINGSNGLEDEFNHHFTASLSTTVTLAEDDHILPFLVFEKDLAEENQRIQEISINEYYFQPDAGSSLNYGSGSVAYAGPGKSDNSGMVHKYDFTAVKSSSRVHIGIVKSPTVNTRINGDQMTWNITQAPVGEGSSSILAPGFESVKTNASYQVGVVYRDRHGRESTVQIDEKASITIPFDAAKFQNSIVPTIASNAPSWAESYKMFVKDNGNKFYNIVMHKAYDNLDGNPDDAITSVWLSFNSSEISKIEIDDFLIAKKKHGSNNPAVPNKFRVLDISNEVPSGSGGIVNADDASEDEEGIVVEGSDANGKFFVKVDFLNFKESITDDTTDSAFLATVQSDTNTNNGAVFEIKKKFSFKTDTLDPKQGFYWEADRAFPIVLDNRHVKDYIHNGLKIELHSLLSPLLGGVDLESIISSFNNDNLDLRISQCIGSISVDSSNISSMNNMYYGFTLGAFSDANDTYFCSVIPNVEINTSSLLGLNLAGATFRFVDEQGNYVTLDAVKMNQNKILFAPFTHPVPAYGASREICINWNNCYSFGNGVESDTIGEGFVDPTLFTYTASNKHSGFKASSFYSGYGKVEKPSDIIFSQIINEANNFNGSNQFILADSITKKLSTDFGSITKMYTRDNDVVAMCEDKVVRILSAGKNALFEADGNFQLVSSSAVLGQTIPYQGDFGCQHAESFAEDQYRIYFVDKARGSVLRLSRDGLTKISSNGMNDWFNDHLINAQGIVGSFDDKKEEYNVTIHEVTNPNYKKNVYTLSFSEVNDGWVSFKSFIPEQGVSLNNNYYTFKQGNIYLHHPQDSLKVSRNLFYSFNKLHPKGTYATENLSTVTSIFNDSTDVVKYYKTIAYEGSQSKIVENLSDEAFSNLVQKDGWYVESVNTDMDRGEVKDFVNKENKWFNYIEKIPTVYTNPFSGDTSLNNVDISNFTVQGLGRLSSSIMEDGESEPTQGFNVTINPGESSDWTADDVIIYNVTSVEGTAEILIVPNGGYGIAAEMFGAMDSTTGLPTMYNDGADTTIWEKISFTNNGTAFSFTNTVTGTIHWTPTE